MRAGYSSGTTDSVLMAVHAIGAIRGRVDCRLCRGATMLSGILMIGVGEKTESALSGRMRYSVVGMFLLGVTLVCCTGWCLYCVDVA